MITPTMLPDPPRILTPPSTAIVTTESSHPSASVGRVLPRREVNNTDAGARHQPDQSKQDQVMSLNINAGVPEGAGRVIANGVGPATKVGFMQQKGKHRRQHNKQRKLKRQRAPQT